MLIIVKNMLRVIKETNGLAIFSFLLAVFCFSTPFIGYFPFPFPHLKIFYAVLDSGGAPIALVSGIGALIWIKKTKEKGRWLAILAIILGGIASTFVSL